MLDEFSETTAYGRRKRDADQLRQRSSHWVERPADICLKPHSPLALSDILAQPGGELWLVADACLDAGEPAEPDKNDRGDTRPVSRRRANLLTRHASDALIERCQQILVDNALIKQRQARRLYLVAGFVADAEARWPVLFYPVVLQRNVVDSNPDDRCRYLLALDGELPEINPHLRRHLQDNHQLCLPGLARHTDLREFFAELASRLTSTGQLELLFDMAVGSCVPPLLDAPGADLDALMPALPAQFDVELARRIARQDSLSELHAVVARLQHYARRQSAANTETSTANAAAAPSNLRLHAEQLVAHGLGQLDCRQLRALPERLEIWADQVDCALQGEVVTDLLSGHCLSARHLIRLGGVIELIDKAPLSIERYAFADLCFASSQSLFRRARHQARLVEEEFNAMRDVFVLERIPPRLQLLQLIDELARAVRHGPDVVGATYFHARRQFIEFSVEKPATLTHDHRRSIAQLEKLLRFRELFVNNTEYRLAFGPGYRGLRTDWAELDNMLAYARELADVLESEAVAGSLLGQWSRFRDAYINEMSGLQHAAEALRRLLAVQGLHYQHDAASEQARRARQSAGHMRQWQEQFGALPDHEELTPELVLGQFRSSTSDTSMHESDLLSWFDQGERSHETLIDTLEWLHQAGNTASELHLNVDAIVDCLRIA